MKRRFFWTVGALAAAAIVAAALWPDPVPVDLAALFEHDGGWAVFSATGGTATLTTVTVGHHNGLEAEITGGDLKPGTPVVVHPSDDVTDGAPIAERQ